MVIGHEPRKKLFYTIKIIYKFYYYSRMLATIIAAIAIAAIAIIVYVGRKIVNMHTHQIFPQNK